MNHHIIPFASISATAAIASFLIRARSTVRAFMSTALRSNVKRSSRLLAIAAVAGGFGLLSTVSLGAACLACQGAEDLEDRQPAQEAVRAEPLVGERSILLANSASHSIEWFNAVGAWLGTFASTGSRMAVGLAQNPLTGDVYVTTLTGTILRYRSSGQTGADWDTLTIPNPQNPALSVLFDAAGNLYVASYYGTAGWEQDIFKYSAASLALLNPSPSDTIPTGLRRGDQMAFDRLGNICIASFIDETVRCFDPGAGAHAQTVDYNAQLIESGISPAVQPAGLAFDDANRLYVSSVFSGQVIKETAPPPGGSFVLLASGLTADVQFVTLNGADLYVPSYHSPEARLAGCSYYACNDHDFSSDTIYRVDTNTGAVSSFITSHAWGPYQMIFARVKEKCAP